MITGKTRNHPTTILPVPLIVGSTTIAKVVGRGLAIAILACRGRTLVCRGRRGGGGGLGVVAAVLRIATVLRIAAVLSIATVVASIVADIISLATIVVCTVSAVTAE